MITNVLKATAAIGLIKEFSKVLAEFFGSNNPTDVFDSAVKNFSVNMNLSEIANKCSPIADKIIIGCQDKGFRFQAGQFKISRVIGNYFNMNFELYFKDTNDEWGNFKITSDSLKADRYLSVKAWLELQNINEKIYAVEAPETETDT